MNNSIFSNSLSSNLDDQLADLAPPSLLSHNSQFSQISDSESVSDDSRKIRKKRNTYHKIPDDIRVELLESVKNGETLKAAAKRFKVNYSSAKSILHTYRKEGRILKKAGQERNTKKRDSSPAENSRTNTTTHTPSIFAKASKQDNKKDKKQNAKNTENDSEFQHDIVPYSERTTSVSTCASLSDENRPALSVINPNEKPLDLSRKESKEPAKRSLNIHPTISSMCQDLAYLNGSGDFGATPKQTVKFFDNFLVNNEFKFPNTDHGLSGNGFNEEDDLMGAFRKVSLDETYFNEHSGLLYPVGMTPAKVEDNNNNNKVFKFDGSDQQYPVDNSLTHFKSFLDTQTVFRDALRRASISFRKNSFDMF